MSEIFQYNLPYQSDAARLFEFVQTMPWAQLLDSGNCQGDRARYDIISADPFLKITTSSTGTVVKDRAGKTIESGNQPFTMLQKHLDPLILNDTDLPFCGGAIGYFGYDLLCKKACSDDTRARIADIPEMAIGIYDWAIITDHQARQSIFVSANKDGKTRSTFEQLLKQVKTGMPASPSANASILQADKLTVDIDLPTYKKDFQRIQDYLVEGDCYQVNYARCFQARAQGSPWESYKLLRKNNPVPFGAYLQFPFAQIICASPERFIQITGKQIETRPIKGTRPRSDNPVKDRALQMELQNSPKDQAENLMIVDLLRNDLGKSCIPGSIRVPEIFSIEAYPTVFHLVSSVTGTIAAGHTCLNVLEDCFPGGSVTGAPKKRAMEIIAELEKHRRGLYCGAIGYISFNGNMDTNIAIRTMTVANGGLSFWAGGAIVADSDAQQEFQEVCTFSH